MRAVTPIHSVRATILAPQARVAGHRSQFGLGRDSISVLLQVNSTMGQCVSFPLRFCRAMSPAHSC